MSIFYGVLQGKADFFKREDNDATPHLQIVVSEKSLRPAQKINKGKGHGKRNQ